jgi:hypothetical protein
METSNNNHYKAKIAKERDMLKPFMFESVKQGSMYAS